MVKRYITQGNLLMEVNRADGGCWVNLVAPTLEECVQIAQEFQIDLADVRAALDDEESSRVDVSNEYSLILFDVPSVEYRHQREAYTTIPLGLILVNDVLLTVCAEATPVLKNFLENLTADCTAIVCENDFIAWLLWEKLSLSSFKPFIEPKTSGSISEMALAAFNTSYITSSGLLRVTTLSYSAHEPAYMAARMISDKLKGLPVSSQEVPLQLIPSRTSSHAL